MGVVCLDQCKVVRILTRCEFLKKSTTFVSEGKPTWFAGLRLGDEGNTHSESSSSDRVCVRDIQRAGMFDGRYA
jgi:hypothetical protein